jgi:hypothetical protein
LPTPLARSILLACRAGAAAGFIAASVGCWEEIKYEPGPDSVRSAQGADAPSGEVASGEAAGPEANTPAPTPASPATSPTTPPADEPPSSKLPLDLTEPPPPSDPTLSDELAAELQEAGSNAPAPSPLAPPEEAPPEATAAQRLLLWQAAGKWSLAAAMFAKQLPAERFESLRTEAVAAAEPLEIDLPPLPSATPEQSAEQAVIAALAGSPANEVVTAVSERYGAAAGSLTDLAIRSNLLLLTYSPRRSDVAEQAARFATAAEASGLPRDAWSPLAKLLDDGGEYVDVRAAVFKLHSDAEKALATPAID